MFLTSVFETYTVNCYIFRCACSPEYTGIHCESRYLPCSPSPCLNGGSCVLTSPTTHVCMCSAGRISMLSVPYLIFYGNTFYLIFLPHPQFPKLKIYIILHYIFCPQFVISKSRIFNSKICSKSPKKIFWIRKVLEL